MACRQPNGFQRAPSLRTLILEEGDQGGFVFRAGIIAAYNVISGNDYKSVLLLANDKAETCLRRHALTERGSDLNHIGS